MQNDNFTRKQNFITYTVIAIICATMIWWNQTHPGHEITDAYGNPRGMVPPTVAAQPAPPPPANWLLDNDRAHNRNNSGKNQ